MSKYTEWIAKKLSPSKSPPATTPVQATKLPALPPMTAPGMTSGDKVTSVSPPAEYDSWAGYGTDNRYHGLTEADIETENQLSRTAEESAEHWKEQCKYWKGMAERNQLKAAGASRTSRGGFGKNKQTFWLTDPANVSNKKSLHRCTKDTIWAHNKFLHFMGQWTVYTPHAPHPFASHVMKHIQVPPALRGFESDYYSDFVLPVVSAKLSSLRGNFIKACGKAFKGTCYDMVG
jgi:hypothetical protein